MGLLSRMGSKALDYGAFGTVGGAGLGAGVGAGLEVGGAPQGTAGGGAVLGALGGGIMGGGAGAMKVLAKQLFDMIKRQRPDIPDEDAAQMVLARLKQANQSAGGLVNDVDQRWNSRADSLDRFMGYDTARDTGGRFP